MDNKLPVLLLGVLHGVKCLLGDAVQVHIPPVLQHLKGDVGAVYHSPRRLGTDKSTLLPTQSYPYPPPPYHSCAASHRLLLKEKTRQTPDIDGLRTFAALGSEKTSWTLKKEKRKVSPVSTFRLEILRCKLWSFILTLKFDIPQVLGKVVKCYF